jgi:hypothetical protein
MEAPRHPMTFIVRLLAGEDGLLSGVVERVRTGEKERFQNAAGLGEVIARMAGRDTRTRPRKERDRE